ncbi:MAG: hypothetical protein H6Q17_1250 [Bacteroidetes bacterium]|nr:hypothetical protein [Bacteroidota bacterium]
MHYCIEGSVKTLHATSLQVTSHLNIKLCGPLAFNFTIKKFRTFSLCFMSLNF